MRGTEQHLSIDLCLSLLSDYRYHLTIILTIKEKVYINVKEEEEKEPNESDGYYKTTAYLFTFEQVQKVK